jgi:hypothetical protein
LYVGNLDYGACIFTEIIFHSGLCQRGGERGGDLSDLCVCVLFC